MPRARHMELVFLIAAVLAVLLVCVLVGVVAVCRARAFGQRALLGIRRFQTQRLWRHQRHATEQALQCFVVEHPDPDTHEFPEAHPPQGVRVVGG